jgi:4-alpha-glucanotransferase
MNASGHGGAGAWALARRRAGVLLHPTSLDGGDGALGARARAFVDWLASAGFSVWQVLPLGPTGKGGSPYWARSDHGGNPRLIDRSERPDEHALRGQFEAFLAANGFWLEDYVLFEALADRFDGAPWWEWPPPYRNRETRVLESARHELAAVLQRRRVEQWQFEWQWSALRAYAAERGILLFGDLPIYVAPDSVATWAAREQFQLTADGRPAVLAGVPPDYFSADGQLWGNPLYDWGRAQQDNFAFWRARLARQLQRFDLLRIDHFRGLAAYWAVPAGSATAREGRWYPAPGAELLRAFAADFPALPIVAEDLGVITPDVEALRDSYHLAGMRVLQFGFGGDAANTHLPHNYVPLAVAYTGTHDNDTTLGWYRSLDGTTRMRADLYLGLGPVPGWSGGAGTVPAAAARAVLASVARLAVLPAQDLLGLGSEARLNTPGTDAGNWGWRMHEGALTPELAARYRALNEVYGR